MGLSVPTDLQMKPPLGATLQPGHPLSTGLVGAWLINEGAGRRIYDHTGNGLKATFSGNPSWTTGPIGNGVLCNDAGDASLMVSDDSRLQFPGDFTVVVWFATVDQTQAGLVSKYSASGSSFVLQKLAGGSIQGAINGVNISAGGSVNDGNPSG